ATPARLLPLRSTVSVPPPATMDRLDQPPVQEETRIVSLPICAEPSATMLSFIPLTVITGPPLTTAVLPETVIESSELPWLAPFTVTVFEDNPVTLIETNDEATVPG